jgi:hypothetical protein
MPNVVRFREIIGSLFPDGPIWRPKPDGDFDKFLHALGDIAQYFYDFLKPLGWVRNPYKTTLLPDLELEYGVVTNEALGEDVRRQFLAGVVYAKPGTGSEDNLESILRGAGFDVRVYQNDPPLDPQTYLSQLFVMYAGGNNGYSGQDNAYQGVLGGDLIVNGTNLVNSIPYAMVSGNDNAYSGQDKAISGYFEAYSSEEIEYLISNQAGRWPFVFFIAADVTGWSEITDWNMEAPTADNWTRLDARTLLSKDRTLKSEGIRSLAVTAVGFEDHQESAPPQMDPLLDASQVDFWRMWDSGGGTVDGLVNGNNALTTNTTNTLVDTGRSLSYNGVSSSTFVSALVSYAGDKITIGCLAVSTANPAADALIMGDLAGKGGIYVDSSGDYFGELVIDGVTYTTPKYTSSVGGVFVLTWETGTKVRLYDGGAVVAETTTEVFGNLDAWSGIRWGVSASSVYFTGLIGRSFAYTTAKTDAWNSRYYDIINEKGLCAIRMRDESSICEDITGNFTCTHNGGGSQVWTRFGPGLDFNGGANDNISAEDAGSNIVTAKGRLEAWIKVDPGNGGTIVGRDDGSVNRHFRWGVNKASGLMEFNDAPTTYTGSTAVDDGAWHKVAVSINGASSRFYLDGATDGSAFSPTITAATIPTLIGAHGTVGSELNHFSGVIVAPTIAVEVRTGTFFSDQYDKELAQLEVGAYAEQTVADADQVRSITGQMWPNDGTADKVVPVVIVKDASSGDWIEIEIGTPNGGVTPPTVQQISDSAPNGFTAIRLMSKFWPHGKCNFDNLRTATPNFQRAKIPGNEWARFVELVLKYKPLHSWALVIADQT